MSKLTAEQAKMGTEGIAFCIARTLIERDPSLKAPMRACGSYWKSVKTTAPPTWWTP
jgi:hypothetical protein